MKVMVANGDGFTASSKGIRFEDMSVEHLRAMAVKTDPIHTNWKDWDKPMLVAFFNNRHGKYVPQQSNFMETSK